MYPTVSNQQLDAVPVRGTIIVPRHQFQQAIGKGFWATFMNPDHCIMLRIAPRGHLWPGL